MLIYKTSENACFLGARLSTTIIIKRFFMDSYNYSLAIPPFGRARGPGVRYCQHG
jgi:hypothetical protein